MAVIMMLAVVAVMSLVSWLCLIRVFVCVCFCLFHSLWPCVSPQPCYEEPCPLSWEYDAWGACQAGCIHSRLYRCRTGVGDVIDESYCVGRLGAPLYQEV